MSIETDIIGKNETTTIHHSSQQNKDVIKLLERLSFIKIAGLDDNEIEYELYYEEHC